MAEKMDFSELLSLSVDTFLGITPEDTVSTQLAKLMVGPVPCISCPVVMGTRDSFYWKTMCQMLDSALFNKDLRDTFKEGFVIGFLLGHFNDVGREIRKINERHGTNIKEVRVSLTKGVLTLKTDTETKLTEMIKYDRRCASTNFFDNGDVVYALKECPEEWYNTIMTQIILIASKAITSPEKCVDFAAKRLIALNRSLPIDSNQRLSDNASVRLRELIKGSYLIRKVIVKVVTALESRGRPSTGLASCIDRASDYLKMTGLTGYKLVSQHVISAKSPIHQFDRLFDFDVFHRLMKIYSELGTDAPFVKFLGHPKAELFNNGNYTSLYLFAVGYAMETDPTMRGYTVDEKNLEAPFYILGRKYGKKDQSARPDNP
ncbi:uncharacterized protein [Hyperolius riggenbachi]|uniref:uncharacterized protein isoform X1 n=1 Tax=Hyperolius riggenbachi TaxID=752182 RepID=UPI0035A2C9C7